MDDSAITCDEIIESYDKETKTVPTNCNEKKATCKTQKCLSFTCIFIIYYRLLTAVSICCHLRKYRANQKHLFIFHETNNELRKILY